MNTFVIHAQGITHNGEGVGRSPDGRAVFVPYVLPGETARVRVTEQRSRFMRAECIELLSAHDGRRTAPCPYYEVCGGCNLQHAEIETQRRLKERIVRELDSRVGGFEVSVEPNAHGSTRTSTVGGAEFGYRNRVRLHRGSEGYGFREKNSEKVVSIESCRIAVPEVNRELSVLNDSVGASSIMLYGAQGRCYRAETAAAETETQTARHEEDAELSVLGKTLRFPVRGFFQSNLEMTERLIADELLDLSGESALELYAGCGLFSAFLVDRFERLTAVESYPASVDAWQRNILRLQGGAGSSAVSKKQHCICDRVETWCRAQDPQTAYDVALLDPPRAGLSKSVREFMLVAHIKRLIYVSCDPASSARDIGLLIQAGYTLSSRRIFDFYPQSSHIETVTVLEGPKRR